MCPCLPALRTLKRRSFCSCPDSRWKLTSSVSRARSRFSPSLLPPSFLYPTNVVFLLFPKLEIQRRHGMVCGKSNSWSRLRRRSPYTLSASNPRQGERKVTPGTGPSAMKVPGRQQYIQLDGSGRAL